MPLVQTFGPHEDESGLGYYRRLAESNSLVGWHEIASLANLARNRATLTSRPEYVAAELGLEPSWAKQAQDAETMARTWRGLHRVAHDAVCPACLDESAYLRRHWEHGYVTACPVHRTRLVERCGGCTELLLPGRPSIVYCPCGQDLRRVPHDPASSGELWLSELIASGGVTTGGIEPKLHRVDLAALSDLAATLCLRLDPDGPSPRRSAAKVRTVREALEFLAPLDALLQDWPVGFERHVAARIQAGDSDARTLNTLLGRWWSELKKACREGALRVFLEAVLRVAATTFDGRVGLDLGDQALRDITGHLPLTDAAKTIGVSRDRLLKAVRDGQCGYRARRFGTRGTAYEIPVSEVDRLQKIRAAWLSEQKACELAQVPPAVMGNMMMAGVVQADVRWRNDITKAGPVSKESVIALLEGLERCADDAHSSGEDVILWAQFTSRRMGDKRAIQALMQAAASGELRVVSPPRSLGQAAFRRSDVAKYFGTPLLEAGLSIARLTKVTGWKWESVAHWVEQGLLESHEIELRGQRCRVVSPQQLLAFRQTYVPLADLARAMGTRASALAELMVGVDIIGAKSLPNGRHRGGLLRIADLGNLALLGARSLLQAPARSG